jgi:2-keto-4-pentenoate hydratase/2-oxohepta-3-ene-1,7-dioic acid hydratase in catechol pathway
LKDDNMKIYRILYEGQPRWAAARTPGELTLLARNPIEGIEYTPQLCPLSAQTVLAPATPSKIVAIGRNYRAHAKELGNEVPSEPLLFLKPPSSLIAHGETIVLPKQSQRIEHEAELAVIIGRRATRVSEKDALSYVFGYSCANDVTARDLQKKDVQFTRGKGFDTFCPLGPCIETALFPEEQEVRCTVNGQLRQEGNTRDMVFSVAFLLSYISHIMTLEVGDVIMTGTPHGVGPLLQGDTVEVSIAGVGVLSNGVSSQ